MPNKHRLIYVAILSALATACSTGSNLKTGNHHPTTNIPGTDGGNEPAKTNFDTITNSEVQKANSSIDDGKTEEPEFGYTQPAPVSGYLYYKENGSPDFVRERYKVNSEQAKIDSAENYDTIAFVNTKPRSSDNLNPDPTKEINISKKYWTEKASALNINDWGSDYDLTFSGDVSDDIKKATHYLYAQTQDAVAGANTLKLFELKNTKIGMVSEELGNKGYANIFYKAKNPSELIPSTGTATYQGLWDLVRDIPGEDPDLQQDTVGYGNPRQFSTATFEVDFSNKSLTGKLAPRTSEILGEDRDFAYDISANIQGNRFTGNATPSNTEEGYKNKLRDAEVKGGFFGEQASELAGTIQNTEKATEATKDKPGFFGVFAAKQTSNENLVNGKEQPPVIYNQAKAITADSKADNIFATNFTEVLAGTEKLPNIDKITINGVEIDLLKEVKKSPSSVFGNEDSLPLQFTRIGGINDDKTDKFSFFYQGQLTQTMPTTGKATYEGNWIGYGKSEKGTPFSMTKDSNAKINFTADFAKKALSGKFMTPAGVDAMTLNDVNITGNTFAGKANIEGRGLVSDKDGVQDRIKGTVNVSGGFFGDKANELGGQFSKDDKNFAGVFAGKKVADK